ncbi:MAG: alpha/beta fold hydrolase [Pirellulales bacterium]|nr:alpha/beta fold hydrolase [Pirellulales bacterium]
MSAPDHWRSLYPFQSHEIAVGGLRYHYLDEGEGEVLLLVHGNPTWSFYWRELVLALRGRFRLVVPDHIGCGLSEKPTAGRYVYRLEQRIADLGQLIRQLDLRQITLLAHDWGGAIGMGAAASAPDRFARFLLLNTAAFRSQHCPWRIRVCRTPLLGRLAVQGLNLFARGALRMAVCRHERMTPAVRAGLLAPYDCWRHRMAVHQFVLDIPLSASHPSFQTLDDVEAGLSRFRLHPICLIWGMKDWCFTPAFLDRFLQFFPQAEVHRLAQAGHYVVEDAHEQIVPLVERFLKKHPLPPAGDPDAGPPASDCPAAHPKSQTPDP